MNLADRLSGRTPDSELPPLSPEDFDDLVTTAQTRGVREFITVLASTEPVEDQPDQTQPLTRFGFETKSGRRVEYNETYGAHPDTRETALSGAATAGQRLRSLWEAGLPANLIDGYFNAKPSIIVDPYQSLSVRVWDFRDAKTIVSFLPESKENS